MFNPVEAVEQFIKQPSVSTDSKFKEGMHGARDHVAGLLEKIGLKVEIAETPLHPVVLGRREGPKEWPHVMIYGHYDVQPADPVELWQTPPFEPIIKDGRLYGRGSADNKGPMMVHIAGFAKLLEKYPDLPLRVTFLIEGEEEIGSPSFNGFIEKYKNLLDVDFILLSDTSSKSEDEIMITTGLRGVACMDVKLIGPNSDLHSGMYGGAVVNPIMALAKLCATLHDDDGKVNIPGFYDDVQFPEPWEREELKRMDDGEESLRQFLGVPALFKHKGYTASECIRFLPTLEYNGIGGGYQGEGSKTIVPSEAFVKISCRVVPDQDPTEILELVGKTLRERCPEGVTMEVDIGHAGGAYCVTPPDRSNTPADQSPILSDAFRAMDAAIKDVYGKPACYSREGGSVPIIGDLKRILGADSLMLGMFTPESKLHAPNESLNVEMFKKGIEVSYRTLASVAKVEA